MTFLSYSYKTMGFDQANKVFTSEIFQSWPEQQVPTIAEMEPGQVGFIDIADIGLDADGNHWIHRYGSVYDDDDVIEVGMEDDEMEFARLIKLEKGYIVDYSHRDQTSWKAISEKYNKKEAPAIAEHPQDYLPIILSITNEEELEYYGEILGEMYNIELADTDLAQILDMLDSLQDELIIEIELDSDSDFDPDIDEDE